MAVATAWGGVGEVEEVAGEDGPADAAGGLDLVEAEEDVVPLGEFGEAAEELGARDAVAAGALEGLDDDADDFVFEGGEEVVEDEQDGLEAIAVFGFGFGVVDVGEGDFQVAAEDAVEVLGDDGVVGELGEVEGAEGAAVEGLVEVDEAVDRGFGFAFLGEALVEEVDEVLHHVLDGLGAGIDGVDLELGIAHALGGEGVQEAVVGEALGGEEVGVGDLVVCGDREAPDVVGLVEAGVVVGEELGAVHAGPVEEVLSFERGEVHAFGVGEVDDEGVGVGDDVVAELFEQVGAGGHCGDDLTGNGGGVHGVDDAARG